MSVKMNSKIIKNQVQFIFTNHKSNKKNSKFKRKLRMKEVFLDDHLFQVPATGGKVTISVTKIVVSEREIECLCFKVDISSFIDSQVEELTGLMEKFTKNEAGCLMKIELMEPKQLVCFLSSFFFLDFFL